MNAPIRIKKNFRDEENRPTRLFYWGPDLEIQKIQKIMNHLPIHPITSSNQQFKAFQASFKSIEMDHSTRCWSIAARHKKAS